MPEQSQRDHDYQEAPQSGRGHYPDHASQDAAPVHLFSMAGMVSMLPW
jgi:hypothetical protein